MLKTTRLNIRELDLEDVTLVHHLHSIPETDKFNTLGIPKTTLVTEKILSDWINEKNRKPRSSYVFAVELKTDKQFIGLIAII